MSEDLRSPLPGLGHLLPPQRPLETLVRCREFTGAIYLMPAGQLAQACARYLLSHGISVTGFIDNAPAKQGTTMDGIPIMSCADFETLQGNALLVMATNEHLELVLRQQLAARGIAVSCRSVADHICYSDIELDQARSLILEREADYLKLYSMFGDDLSRQTLLARLRYLVTHDERHWQSVVRPSANQYFEPTIYAISSRDVFVDCGAYDGDTFESLSNLGITPLAGYHGFEPDEKNFARLVAKTRAFPWVSVYRAGVYRENTVLRFLSSNTASQVCTDGTIEVDVVSLDAALAEKRVSFIKMDVEGAERDALNGAQRIIQRQRPVLAVSVYHRFHDLCDIPFLIGDIAPDYRFFLRHYSLRSPETVLYAIPLQEQL